MKKRVALEQTIPQGLYANMINQNAAFYRDLVKALPEADQTRMRMMKGQLAPDELTAGRKSDSERVKFARMLLKGRKVQLEKAGPAAGTFDSALGYNFYDLRGPAYLLSPVNTPFRNTLARVGRVSDGYGVAAHWMATRDFGTQYAGVLEGQRNASAAPDNNQYIATYKELGIERGATFTSQFAGEGFTDNVADEHLRGMYELWLQEEGIMIGGNGGTGVGNNGFSLAAFSGVAPVAVLAAGGAITDGAAVYAKCVALTMLANPRNTQFGYGLFPTVASGLTPNYTRDNADGSQTSINGGMSPLSTVSNGVEVTGGNHSVTFTVDPPTGAFSFAWFVCVSPTDGAYSDATAYLAAITPYPTVTIAANPSNANQSAAQFATLYTAATSGSFAGNDPSAQPTDFDGLFTYAANAGQWINQGGASFTSNGDGTIDEVENDLQTIWDLYQTQPRTMWMDAFTKTQMMKAIRNGGANPSSYRFDYARDQQNNILGGYVVSAYQSAFSMNDTGADALPMKIHPMFPTGTLFYDIDTNPYPSSRIPYLRAMLVQRDYYSIEWPLVTRTWTFGTYCHEVLAHTMPWLTTVRTGIGPFVS